MSCSSQSANRQWINVHEKQIDGNIELSERTSGFAAGDYHACRLK